MTEQRPDTAFHWFLPTGGDGRRLGGAVHGTGIGAQGGRSSGQAGGERPASLGYLSQLAEAVDELGYEGVLTPTGAHCEDSWLVTAALIARTRRLKFLVAFRPGLVEPALAAQMAATFQRLSGGRLLLNVVAGGSDAEQRGYGDQLGHDARYARAEEFLDVVREAWTGKPFDHRGEYYQVEGGLLRQPPEPVPRVYFGGSSAPALDLAARHADTYLTWGEPVAQVAEKIDRVRELAQWQGREPRFGLRVHVLSRATSERAWQDAEELIAGLDDEAVASGQRRLRAVDSEGQRRMLALHGGDRSRLVVAPNLWAGVGLVRGGAGTALVGSHEEVAERIDEYRAAGVDEFVLSGYPHLEEAYTFAECVRPLL
ncbi:LLM class flavin-dependent oxidoreductase [Streptacidiphilus sp. P02-A3a]|uniref:LLM class flavin-dependent oxidoreductase n=1 Tax=Streptacidiphilus sp. P02-A3a TaxID=2704468 RepID=UPI0015FDEA8F|nr:LLM class flavin-dependent oxidoreductase [Streptacidiphilus sp. P02-A3a]QMU69342.1 LLM class flavin-dependent oxidoreductase [Streptacidiphilus sp. P02-A3a]